MIGSPAPHDSEAAYDSSMDTSEVGMGSRRLKGEITLSIVAVCIVHKATHY